MIVRPRRPSRTAASAASVGTVMLVIGVLCTAVVFLGALALLALPAALVYWFVQGVRDRPTELTRDALRNDAERAAWDRAYADARSQAAISNRR